MISLYKINKRRSNNNTKLLNVELRGLSTDEKPTTLNDALVDNGSVYLEIDTQKVFFYDLENSEWKGV